MELNKNYVRSTMAWLLGLAAATGAAADPLLPGLNMPLFAQASPTGQLDLTQTDIGRLMDRQMVEYFSRQREDARYFAEQLTQLESMFVRFSNLVTATSGGAGAKTYADLVNQSVAGDYPSADEFLRVRSAIIAEERAIRARLATLRAMNRSALPSAKLAATPSKDVEIPGFYALDFAPIADHYDAQFKVVSDYVGAQRLAFLDKVGIKVDVEGIEFNGAHVSLITEAERKARLADILAKRRDADLAWAAQNKLTREIIRGTKGVLELRGVEDRRRFQTAADREEREAKVKRLGDAFLYHSYLRLKYRQPVGTFLVEYKPLTFNRDQLAFAPAKYVKSFSDTAIRNRGDVERSVTNFQRAVLAGGMRQGEGNTFFAGALLHGWDFLRGYSSLSKLGFELFQMLYADAREEIAMDTGEGVDTFDQIFKERFLPTPEARRHALTALCAIDRDVACPEGRESRALGGLEQNGGFPSLASEALAQTQGRLNALKQASDLQRTLDDLTRVPRSDLGRKVVGNIGVLSP